MRTGTYTQRRKGSFIGNNGAAQQIWTITLPKSACEIRFKVLSQTTKLVFGWSYDARFAAETVVPNLINGATNDNFDWNVLNYVSSDYGNALLGSSTEEIVIRKTIDMPNALFVFPVSSGDTNTAELHWQIVGGSNNGY